MEVHTYFRLETKEEELERDEYMYTTLCSFVRGAPFVSVEQVAGVVVGATGCNLVLSFAYPLRSPCVTPLLGALDKLKVVWLHALHKILHVEAHVPRQLFRVGGAHIFPPINRRGGPYRELVAEVREK